MTSTTSTPGPDTDQSLAGTRALVTGATSGIGRAVALHLGRSGAEVVVHGRDAARGAGTVDAIVAAGGRARFAGADLSDAAAVRALAAAAGDVDILVNNAGFAAFAPTADLDLDTYDQMFASNVRAPFLLVAALAPAMVARGSGSIIGISSMVSQVGLAGAAAYGATKSALDSMTRAWAAEFSAAGVRVNTVAPGPVQTGPEPIDFIDQLGKTTPMGRAANTSEIAEVVAFLASPRASYITGAVIPVDGGRTAV